jgi:hypothetical protein
LYTIYNIVVDIFMAMYGDFVYQKIDTQNVKY